MTRFEYLSVLVSIVIALGLTEVTISWGRSIQLRTRMSFDWLHAFWSIFVVFLMIQLWWGFWNYRTVENWSMLSLTFVVSEAITLVLCALLLTPRHGDEDTYDHAALFQRNSKPFFLLGALYIVQLTLLDKLVLGSPIMHMENLFRIPGVFVALAAAHSTSRAVHAGLALAALFLLMGFLSSALTL